MMKPTDPRKCDDRCDLSEFDRPLFRSVLF
jgi:hypothetical protein